MFSKLSNRLSNIIKNINNKGKINKKNIQNILKKVRISLLEADVSLTTVKDFISEIESKILGKEIQKNFTPSQEFINIVYTTLVKLMGSNNKLLNLSSQSPAIILFVGLQGVGKTTSVGKISKYLLKKKKKILVTSTDIYRPASNKQLKELSNLAGVDYFEYNTKKKPNDIVYEALHEAKKNFYDVLLIDTPGLLHTDNNLMEEIIDIKKILKPIETLLIVDSMTGQDAVNIVKIFNKKLKITGVILTKLDGDTRGGVALSITHITGKKIKFIGIGEKINDLKIFYPERIAKRILGMGDILSLIEEIKSKINIKEKEKINRKIKKNNNFDYTDFLNQLKQMRKIGGISKIINYLPKINILNNDIKSKINDDILIKMEAIINSMTIKERLCLVNINLSRKKRIASGSGVKIKDVDNLIKQFKYMQLIFKKIKKNGITKIFKNIKEIMKFSF